MPSPAPTVDSCGYELTQCGTDMVYDNRAFGNFLGNWEKQRVDLKVQEKTTSIWAYVMKSTSLFKNNAYQPLPQPIEPTASLKKVRLWERYYCRWDSAMHPHELAGIDWIDDWGTVDQVG